MKTWIVTVEPFDDFLVNGANEEEARANALPQLEPDEKLVKIEEIAY